MDKLVESAKKSLEEDLNSYPQSLSDPIGFNGTKLKIKKYLYACVVEGEDRADCKDWLYNLYAEQADDEKGRFVSRIDLLANALYDFYEYLGQTGIIQIEKY